jgi:hypothetical protein
MPLSPAWARNVARRVLWAALEREISTDERKALAAAFGGRCAYCDDPLPDRWHADHLVPVDQGGYHHLSNRVPSCPKCNEGEKGGQEWRPFLEKKWGAAPDKGVSLIERIEGWRTGKAFAEPPVSDVDRELWRTQVEKVGTAIDSAWRKLRERKPARGRDQVKDLAEFRVYLAKALAGMLWLYFRTPVAGSAEEQARERLFCYELYHHLRMACDDADFDYWIGGELDKRGHPLIRGNYIPDLLIHEPGDMGSNLCIIEVKHADAGASDLNADLDKLKEFVTKYRYYGGILLVFGGDKGAGNSIRRKISTHPDFKHLRDLRIAVSWMRHAQGKIEELV